jgi:hypothetical protein
MQDYYLFCDIWKRSIPPVSVTQEVPKFMKNWLQDKATHKVDQKAKHL